MIYHRCSCVRGAKLSLTMSVRNESEREGSLIDKLTSTVDSRAAEGRRADLQVGGKMMQRASAHARTRATIHTTAETTATA